MVIHKNKRGCIGGLMDWSTDDVDLVPIDWLKPHEEIRKKNLAQLKDMTLRWDGYTKPLLVDQTTGAILDGHHRYNVGLELELSRLPVLKTDYMNDENVQVTVWPNSDMEDLTKQDVIDMALSENLYPPKTSKHVLSKDIPPIYITLEELRKS